MYIYQNCNNYIQCLSTTDCITIYNIKRIVDEYRYQSLYINITETEQVSQITIICFDAFE